MVVLLLAGLNILGVVLVGFACYGLSQLRRFTVADIASINAELDQLDVDVRSIRDALGTPAVATQADLDAIEARIQTTRTNLESLIPPAPSPQPGG